MARIEQRQAALRLCLLALAGLASFLAWVALLTFDAADPPSASHFPANATPSNWCGVIGAHFAYTLFYWFGWGAFALLLLLTGFAGALANGWRRNDAWLRTIGVGLVVASSGGLAAHFVPTSEDFLITGPGGLLGSQTEQWLVSGLKPLGATVVMGFFLLVGLLFAADEALMAILNWTSDAGKASLPTVGEKLRQTNAVLGGALRDVTDRISAAQAERAAGATAPVHPQGNGRNGKPAREAETARPQRTVTASKETLGLRSDADVPPIVADPADLPEPGAAAREARPLRAALKLFTGGSSADELDSEPEQAAPAADLPAPVPAPPAAARPATAVETPAPRPVAPPVRPVQPPPKPAGPPPAQRQVGQYVLPPLSLLEDAEPIEKEAITRRCREQAYILEQTLNEFRLEVKVAAIDTGPVITVFELALAPGIKVSQIASLTNDMARALKAPAVRVVAPLPGKDTIGIEVPNLDKEKVRIKDLMLNGGLRAEKANLPLYLGKDASGEALVSDLTKMPHLLIAGTTGSGKSVCVSTIIMSFLATRSPDEVQLVLVDPKVVELTMFKDIPHLMCPIVTEMSKAEAILDWASTKMDERYALLAEAGVKDIVSYNGLGEAKLRERMHIESDEEFARVPVQLPYIVIVIDELADMMMTSPKEVEFHLCRIAQKSRAVGIHLIVSTQRPQANVVTGLIKSNLPCRIAFRVSSRLDSRIVLDQNGGEVLMGQGDMLFLPPGSSKLVRAQGAYVSDDELRALVRYCRDQRQPNYHPELMRSPKAGAGDGERDEMFDEAVRLVIESGRGSVSLLQRKLTIGYGRASRLIEQMYEAGIVGDYKGSQAREVTLTLEEWDALRSQRDSEEAAERAN